MSFSAVAQVGKTLKGKVSDFDNKDALPSPAWFCS